MAQPRTVRSNKAPAELIATRISAEDKRRIHKAAKRRGVTPSELIRNAVLRDLENTA